MTENAERMLASARAYVSEVGWFVLPLDMKTKHPPLKEWQNRATIEEGVVERWFRQFPNAGVCIPTGEINDLVVLDVDPRNGGIEALAKAEADLGALPKTLRSFSGREEQKGWHLFFSHPGGIVAAPRWFKEKYEGLDVKADKIEGGVGHQVVLPPSLHASSGKPYTWDGELDVTRIQPLPLAWAEALRPEDRTAAPDVVGKPTEKDLNFAAMALDSAVEQLEESRVGHDNNLLNENALSMFRFALAGLLDADEVTKRLRKAAEKSKTPGISDTLKSARTAADRLGPKCGPDGENGIWAGDEESQEDERARKVRQRVDEILIQREASRIADEIRMREIMGASSRARIMTGAEFVLDIPDSPPVLWGDGREVIWSDAQGLLIVGDDGTGKTTIDHQLIAARLGVRFETVLGYPVEEAKGKIVYLAMDRPEQARLAMARLFPKAMKDKFHDKLAERLAIWNGPLPINILSRPDALAEWLQGTFGRDVCEVHVDSLKDIASRLSDEEVGGGINSAMQECLARGINFVALHHQRKQGSGGPRPDSLSDVYGSRMLVAGQGSVLMLLKGEDEDQDVVELKQVKQPMDRIRSTLLRHDRSTGRTIVEDKKDDLEGILDDLGEAGGSISEIARRLYDLGDQDKLTTNHRNKTKSHLQAYLLSDKAVSVGKSTATKWYAPQHAPK